MPAGMIPSEITRLTHVAPARMVGNPSSAARVHSGLARILTVTSVITPSRPSEPVITPSRS